MADTPLTDEYVANLLAKDAKDSSIKYSALGMEAFLPSKFVLKAYNIYTSADIFKTSS